MVLYMSNFKKVRNIFISGKLSATLIIPIEIARKYGIDKPSNVIIEETKDGILIRKVDVHWWKKIHFLKLKKNRNLDFSVML